MMAVRFMAARLATQSERERLGDAIEADAVLGVCVMAIQIACGHGGGEPVCWELLDWREIEDGDARD